MSTPKSISQRLDRLPGTPLLWKVLFISGFGLMFDAMDQGMVAGVIASIGKEWTALTELQLGFLVSSGVLGMMLGALVSGLAADRWGRRTVVLFTLLIFCLGSALSGFAPSYELLLIARFFTGIGLGGELPVITTLASEFSSLKSRGRNVVIVESFWAWGWILAMLVAYLAIPLYGWRVAFIIGAVPALFAAVLRFIIPESPRYLEKKGRLEEAHAIVSTMERQARIPAVDFSEAKAAAAESKAAEAAVGQQARQISALKTLARLWSTEHRRSTIMLWILWFGVNFGYYGFVVWTPTFLVAQGYELVKSLEVVLIMCFAQLPGYALAAVLIEKIGRKPTLTLFLLGTAGAAWFFGHASSIELVIITGCFLYFFALGAWGCVYSYTPELYPTEIRGAGAGFASTVGRVGAFLAPMIVPVVYAFFGAESGFEVVFVILTIVFIVVALAVGFFGVETKGREYPEDIADSSTRPD